MLNIIFFLFCDFAATNGKVFLVETKTNSKNVPEFGENYREDKGHEMNRKFGDYNNHLEYCNAFPHIDICQDTKTSTRSSTTTPITTSTPTITSTSQEIIDPISTGNCNCGRGMPMAESGINEISGGREAPPNAFPWIVRLVDGCPGECGKKF